MVKTVQQSTSRKTGQIQIADMRCVWRLLCTAVSSADCFSFHIFMTYNTSQILKRDRVVLLMNPGNYAAHSLTTGKFGWVLRMIHLESFAEPHRERIIKKGQKWIVCLSVKNISMPFRNRETRKPVKYTFVYHKVSKPRGTQYHSINCKLC